MPAGAKQYIILVPVGTSKVVGTDITSGTTGSTSVWTCTTTLGGSITALITNGSSPPTVPCDFVVQASGDSGATWKEINRQSAGTTASISYPMNFTVEPGYALIRVVFTGNTVNAVTVEAQAHEFSSIG